MKKVPVCRLDLGQTRVAGFTLYDPKSREFQETTQNEVKKQILASNVNGLKLCDNEIVLDTDGFNMQNLKIKTAVGKYRNMFPSEHEEGKFYAVVRLLDTDEGRLFEVVDNKCARVKVDAAKLMMLISFSCVAGVKVINDEIELCEGVIYEDRRTELTDNDLDKLINSDEIVDFNGRLVKLSELKELARLNTTEALAGLIEGEPVIAQSDVDFNQLNEGFVQNNASKNDLIADGSVSLKEFDNESNQQWNQIGAASGNETDTVLPDNTPGEEESDLESYEQSFSGEKQTMGTGIETAVQCDNKAPVEKKKTNSKKTSIKAK